MAPQCTALNVSDESRCEDEASSLNGLFCLYHSKQCQALYKGYKRRNTHLESLAKEAPIFLANNKTPLANQTFQDVTSEEVLREVRAHLLLRHALLDRVIRARKLHHSRFFSMTLDYGHQAYLDNLSNQKSIAMQALQRLERRTAEVLYQRRNWFSWVRNQQDEEESRRETEKKRIRHEAALFKRHWAQVKQHIKELRIKEDLKRQEDYLEEAFKARMSLEQDNLWDPIEDVVEDERDTYIDMLKLFLFMKDETLDVSEAGADVQPIEQPVEKSTEKPKKKSKGQKGEASDPVTAKTGSESKSQMRQRLQKGTKYVRGPGIYFPGTVELPVGTMDGSAPLPDDVIDQLLEEITEIKQLLLCRIILSHASVLPAALRAGSVEDFLADEEINLADLKAICLKMENPQWQEVRDACADLFRGDEEEREEVKKDDVTDQATIIGTKGALKPRFLPNWRRGAKKSLPVWPSTQEQSLRKQRQRRQKILDKSGEESQGQLIDFGAYQDETEQLGRKVRIRLCGRSIYNYPSEKAMNRGGWLHFSIIAKDSALSDAVTLCRHWDEFLELCTLTVFQFFPAGNWMEWVGDRLNQQLLRLGFMPYQEFRGAEELTSHHQSGSRGHTRRSHAVLEARNFVAGYVKRNDPASRRFIQYLSMQTYRVLVLVRDGKTGEVLLSPPPDEMWLVREKSGLGRAVKNQWKVLKEVGPDFFEVIEKHRRWRLGFDDYYDVIMWDLSAGESFGNVYSTATQMLLKAHRVRDFKENYKLLAPILDTLTREPDTLRVREIRANEDGVRSIYKEIHNEETVFKLFNEHRKPIEKIPKDLLYNDVDALEDQILFGEEVNPNDDLFSGNDTNNLNRLESQGPDINRFIFDLDTDEELSDDEDCEDSCEDCSEDAGDWEEDEEDEEAEEAEEEDDDDDEENYDIDSEGLNNILEPRSGDGWSFGEYVVNFAKAKGDPMKQMEEQFVQFVRREASRAFKEGWHLADIEPGAREKYAEALDLIGKMEKHLYRKGSLSIFRPCHLLHLDPFAHRRVVRDMRKAYAMMSLFFPYATEQFAEEYEGDLWAHMILKQEERAKKLLDRRSATSNTLRPKDFWKELNEVRKSFYEGYPDAWDRAIRPIIAILYKEGILRNSYLPLITGRAFGHQEGTRPMDLFVDFRPMIPEIQLNEDLQTPPPPSTLLSAARTFALKHQFSSTSHAATTTTTTNTSSSSSAARFALLRIWSSPHFYPLLIGLDRRERLSFWDSQGRAWEWKFIPKDMPYSEMSMHHQARLRILPFRTKKVGAGRGQGSGLGPLSEEKVLVMRDVVLVMGVDEEDLLVMAAATTYAIQTDPWRLEVDLWRSFVNLDIEGLEGLDMSWWE